MKFARILKEDSTPEWKKKYIDYKALKKLLHQVEKVRILRELESVNNHGNSYSFENRHQRSSRIQEFSPPVDDNNAGTWSISSVTDATKPIIRRMSMRLTSLGGRGSFIAPIHQRHSVHRNITLETLYDQVNEEERRFFEFLDKELRKIEEFYSRKEEEAEKNFKILKLQYKEMKELKRRLRQQRKASQPVPMSSVIARDTFPVRRSQGEQGGPETDINHKEAKKKIKKALIEFYRGAELLRNYRTFNHTGFVKILKKFDKLAGWNGSDVYIQRVDSSTFVTSKVLDNIIKETENFYADKFEGGMRRQAMSKLRIPDGKHQTHYFATWRVGMYLGISFALYALVAADGFNQEDRVWNTVLTIYGGFVLPILLALLIGLNMIVWTKMGINYKFIFEFDPRENLDYRQYFELPALALLLHSTTLFLAYKNPVPNLLPQNSYPAIFAVIFFSIFFCPFPIMYYEARRWLIIATFRVILSYVFRVEFRDFFIGDELNSLSYSITSYGLFACVYTKDWPSEHGCDMSGHWITPIIASLPAWWRFLQCCRRYSDTRQWYPHLVNAGKYISSILAISCTALMRMHDAPSSLFIVMQSVNSLYTASWDVFMDWSLMQLGSENLFLRDSLGFNNKWVYYYAIVSNFFLRWSWVLLLISPKLIFIVAFVEVLRRWQWNFFRVENEHINNCDQFRAIKAIKEVPLPFPLEDDEPDSIVVNTATGEPPEQKQASSRMMVFVRSWLPSRRDTVARDFEPRRDRNVAGMALNSDEDEEDEEDEGEDEDEDEYYSDDGDNGDDVESFSSILGQNSAAQSERRKNLESSLRKLERLERSERPERPERSERPEGSERLERSERLENDNESISSRAIYNSRRLPFTETTLTYGSESSTRRRRMDNVDYEQEEEDSTMEDASSESREDAKKRSRRISFAE